MADFDSKLATKLGQQTNGARTRQSFEKTSGRPPAPTAALQVPVEIREQSKKPKRLMVTTSRVKGKDGKPVIIMTPAPGFVISRVILSDIDEATRRCKPAVITERRRGRPANSQRRENGATEV